MHLDRTVKQLRLLTGATLFLATLSALGVMTLLMMEPRIPEPLAESQLPAGRHRVDLVVIDMPTLTNQDITLLVQPLLMVADIRMPGESQHFRVLVSSGGFAWPYPGSEFGAAGYVAEEDLFLVDAQAVSSSWPEFNKNQRWAFAMAHEGAHLWQRKRGVLPDRASRANDREAYTKDPIEIEAYREGLTAANAFPGEAFMYQLGDEQLVALSPNPYVPLAFLDVNSRADIHVHSQTTPLGMVRTLRDLVSNEQATNR